MKATLSEQFDEHERTREIADAGREDRAEIKRLRAALEIIASDYRSGPCTVMQGAALLAAEFQRRMGIARDALDGPPK